MLVWTLSCFLCETQVQLFSWFSYVVRSAALMFSHIFLSNFLSYHKLKFPITLLVLHKRYSMNTKHLNSTYHELKFRSKTAKRVIQIQPECTVSSVIADLTSL